MATPMLALVSPIYHRGMTSSEDSELLTSVDIDDETPGAGVGAVSP